MIYHLMVFLVMIGIGSVVWFYLQLILDYIVNFMVVNFPQWFSNAFVTFFIATSDWGLLLLCWFPAALYLWTNTQRPKEIT